MRSRGWSLTLNNYSVEELEHLHTTFESADKYIIGKEVGASGTPHLQMYVYWKNAKSFECIKRINNRLHIEPAKGNPKQNFSYCSKESIYATKGFINSGNSVQAFIDELQAEAYHNQYHHRIYMVLWQRHIEGFNILHGEELTMVEEGYDRQQYCPYCQDEEGVRGST